MIEPLRVLVADDEPTILEILNLALTEMGHTVTTACNGKSALEQALEIDFDLIITDLKMPQMGGLEFTRRLVELRPMMSNRIILITGDVSELTAALQKTPAALHILPKPFGMAELTHAIDSWWARRRHDAAAQQPAS
ncbi:MAG TPA: response regulator [Patescibacteria group bacterium]|nr:response regulator [Patescibacteria group bacterium]